MSCNVEVDDQQEVEDIYPDAYVWVDKGRTKIKESVFNAYPRTEELMFFIVTNDEVVAQISLSVEVDLWGPVYPQPEKVAEWEWEWDERTPSQKRKEILSLLRG